MTTLRRSISTLALLGALFLSIGPGCIGGDEGSGESPAVESGTTAVSADMVAKTWPVRMSDDAARAPFEAQSGWAALFQRDHGQALAAFAGDPASSRALARTHLELSAIYRQAALLAAHSSRHVYGELRVDEDPVEADYLLAVGGALTGDLDTARTALTALGGAGEPTLQASAADWRAWLDGGAAWPPDGSLGDLPGAPGEVSPGTRPDLGELPHYRFVERSDEARAVEAADPGSLWLLARWHEAAARAAAPDDGAIMDMWLDPWRLPAEPHTGASDTPVDDAWLFGGFLMAPEDLPFLAAASKDGAAAVAAWKGRSPLAAVVAPAIVDGKVVPDKMLDQSAWFGQQLEAAMEAKSGGEQAYHGPFGQIARVSALRAAMVVADAEGQYRDAGVLRINALDRSVQAAADPVFIASVAAWDAGNKNALRAQELVHRLVQSYPSVQAARYPLDALHIRLSRNAAPAAPVH